ncbi:MAG TPA: hypothetical protein DEB40_01335 [Elusimicrobia bacterium]|nr:hypothetical protein [Elusimicrobiota bacterium]HBT60373.1 hypothetical protein [Elusimicrobiota bacterium]
MQVQRTLSLPCGTIGSAAPPGLDGLRLNTDIQAAILKRPPTEALAPAFSLRPAATRGLGPVAAASPQAPAASEAATEPGSNALAEALPDGLLRQTVMAMPRAAADAQAGGAGLDRVFDQRGPAAQAADPQPQGIADPHRPKSFEEIPSLDPRYTTPESKARTVTIMGSSQSPEKIRAFIELAGRAAGELARRGYNILTGCGKDGVMGAAYDAAVAASRAPAQNGIQPGENLAIVVTPAWRDENLEDARAIGIADSEPARVEKFQQASDTFIIFAGGAYTLPEATILIGKNRYAPPEQRKRIIIVGREWFAGLRMQYQRLYEDGTLGKNKDGAPVTPEQLFTVVDTFEGILAALPASADLAQEEAKGRAAPGPGAPARVAPASSPETVVLYPNGEESLQRALELIALNRYRLHGPRKKIILVGQKFFAGLKLQYRRLFEDGTLGVDPDELFQVVESRKERLKRLSE